MTNDATGDEGQKPPPSRGRRLRASDVAVGAAVGALLMFVALVVVSRRQAIPPLTVESLETARRRWEESGAADYRMDIVVSGRQASRYHVEVAGGKPASVLQNDRPIARRNWPYWTVPGLFDVIEHDVDCADDPTRGFGARPGSKAVLRADFDPRRGYPRKFERLILGEPQLDMTWEVATFDDGAAANDEAATKR
ncbi:MAG TPA: DUF6174 domain-containing protein [Pirellulales bacterium]|jgi:hypothetical protein|nr:DUF6174 domain-containing protein [Pirellulales bacterium]